MKRLTIFLIIILAASLSGCAYGNKKSLMEYDYPYPGYNQGYYPYYPSNYNPAPYPYPYTYPYPYLMGPAPYYPYPIP